MKERNIGIKYESEKEGKMKREKTRDKGRKKES